MKSKINYIFTAICVSIITMLAVSSCQEYSVFDEYVIQHDMAINEYNKNFIERYGTPDPNHTWGLKFNVGPASAPATRTWVAVNKNQWYTHYNLVVPGNPTQNHLEGSTDYTEEHQMGDVTLEEVEYVSWWFRTHKNEKSDELHLADFFVQEISSDCDRDENGNKLIKSHRAAFRMNYLHCAGLEHEILQNYKSSVKPTDYIDINNFNRDEKRYFGGTENMYVGADDTNKIFNSGLTFTKNLNDIGFVYSSGTEDFAYYSSDDSQFRNRWLLKHLEFKGKSGKQYSGWYLGFDYEFDGTKVDDNNQYHPFDGAYSNWILKITPATRYVKNRATHEVITQRIMCEDLGNTCDFDFNDVVFDATYTSSDPSQITIKIQAAGGTLPIYVGIQDDKYEAHKLLGGTSTATPINVAANQTNTAAIYQIPSTGIIENGVVDFSQIKVWVTYPDGTTSIVAEKIPNNNFVSGESGKDHAPKMFGVPSSVKWMKEKTLIENGYWYFNDWTKHENYTPAVGKQWYYDEYANVFYLVEPNDPVTAMYAKEGSEESGGTGGNTGSEVIITQELKTKYSAHSIARNEKGKYTMPKNASSIIVVYDKQAQNAPFGSEQAAKGYQGTLTVNGTTYNIDNNNFINESFENNNKFYSVNKFNVNSMNIGNAEYFTVKEDVIPIFVGYTSNDNSAQDLGAYVEISGGGSGSTGGSDNQQENQGGGGTQTKQYTVTVQPNNSAWGAVTGGGIYTLGANVELTATPNEGYRFVKWTYANGAQFNNDQDNPVTIYYLNEDKTVIAEFEAIPKYTVTIEVNDASMGTVTGGGTYYEKSTVTLTAKPKSGYRFVKWTDTNGEQLSTENPYTLNSIQENKTVKAVFVDLGTAITGFTSNKFNIEPAIDVSKISKVTKIEITFVFSEGGQFGYLYQIDHNIQSNPDWNYYSAGKSVTITLDSSTGSKLFNSIKEKKYEIDRNGGGQFSAIYVRVTY